MVSRQSSSRKIRSKTERREGHALGLTLVCIYDQLVTCSLQRTHVRLTREIKKRRRRAMRLEHTVTQDISTLPWDSAEFYHYAHPIAAKRLGFVEHKGKRILTIDSRGANLQTVRAIAA